MISTRPSPGVSGRRCSGMPTVGRPTLGSRSLKSSATRVTVCAAAPPAAVPTLALKEWAVTIGALGAGEQTVLLRKGGIREPTFKPEASEFVFFPTAFHSDLALLKPGVAQRFEKEMQLDPRAEEHLHLGVYAQLTGAWVTDDPRVLEATDALHVWGPAFLQARLKWRSKQPMTVLELRVWRLAQPLTLRVREELFGCYSWVDVAAAVEGAPLALAGARPALDDTTFRARQQLMRAAMTEVGARPLDVSLCSLSPALALA